MSRSADFPYTARQQRWWFATHEVEDAKVREDEARRKEYAAEVKRKADAAETEAWFKGSKIVGPDGQPLVVYHQTSPEAAEAIAREGFRTDLGKARLSDERVPDGVFFKPTDANIGVGSDNAAQIPVHLSIKNPLVVGTDDSGAAFQRLMADSDKEYARLWMLSRSTDQKFMTIDSQLNATWATVSRGRGSNAEHESLLEQMEANLDKWKAEMNAVAASMRGCINTYLDSNGYDGLILERDRGSFGRSTRTIVALKPSQIRVVKR